MPRLQTGALYIKPGSTSADVFFSQWPDARASVSGSHMIVEIQGNDLAVYCFQGNCQLFVAGVGREIPAGSMQIYRTALGEWDDAIPMSYDDQWDWNVKCNQCMSDLIPTPTSTATPLPFQQEPTKDKGGDDDPATQPPPTSTKKPPPTSTKKPPPSYP